MRLFLIATLLWIAHADTTSTIEEQLTQCQAAQKSKCKTVTAQLEKVLESSQEDFRKKQEELQTETSALQARCQAETAQLRTDLDVQREADVLKNDQYWHNQQVETIHKYKSEQETQRAASEQSCNESTSASEEKWKQEASEREQKWILQVQELEQQVQVLTQQHVKDMELVAQRLNDSHDKVVHQHVKQFEETRDQHKDSVRDLDKTKVTLLLVRQELLVSQERVQVLEKEATYYWDLLEEYKLFVQEHYNRVKHFLETNEQVQAVYQPTKAAVLSLWAQFLVKATPIWEQFVEEFAKRWEQCIEEITKRIPPQVSEHHGLLEGHFCVLTKKANSFCKLQEAPDRFIVASEWLERNCAPAFLCTEVALVLFLVLFLMRALSRAIFGAPKKIVPAKKEPVKSNHTAKHKKKKTQ
jgi:hypothetical protein